MDYKDMFSEILGSKNLASKQGLSGSDFTKGIGALIPELLNQLNQRAENPQEIEGLDSILKKHQDDDFDNSEVYVEKLDNSEKDTMIDTILGGKRESIERQAAEKSGLDENTIKKILYIVAPIILMYLSKNKKEKGLKKDDIKKETAVINKKAKETGIYGAFVNMFDKDGDGSVLDDFFNL